MMRIHRFPSNPQSLLNNCVQRSPASMQSQSFYRSMAAKTKSNSLYQFAKHVQFFRHVDMRNVILINQKNVKKNVKTKKQLIPNLVKKHQVKQQISTKFLKTKQKIFTSIIQTGLKLIYWNPKTNVQRSSRHSQGPSAWEDHVH